MDKKQFLADPEKAVIGRWGHIDHAPNGRQMLALHRELEQLKDKLKQTLQEKQVCARLFGEAKAAGADIEPLRRRMQETSSALKSLEAQRRELENELWSLVQDPSASAQEIPSGRLPTRFTRQWPDTDRSAAPVTIEAIDDAQAGQWDAYVDRHAGASLYHRYAWRTVVARAFGHETLYLLARRADSTLCGLLPIVRLNSRLFGDFAVSLPFFNYGGVLADDQAVAAQLLERAAFEAEQRQLRHLEIRSTQRLNDWPARTDKLSMILALPGSAEQLERQLGTKIRAQIKRARQENPDIAIGGKELLDDFYRVFATNMRDLGTPVYGKNFFRTVLDTWPDRSHLVVLRLAGRPVAAAFLVGDRDTMEIPWASTLRSANPLNMNMLLYWHVLQFSIEQGYPFFDFGRSTRDAGTYRFKKQWGAQPVQHYWHYWLPADAPMPELKPDSPKFRFLVKCWQKLPVPVTRLLGPAIVRYLP